MGNSENRQPDIASRRTLVLSIRVLSLRGGALEFATGIGGAIIIAGYLISSVIAHRK